MFHDRELFKSRHSHHFVGITAVAETRARKKNHTAAGAQLLALQSKSLHEGLTVSYFYQYNIQQALSAKTAKAGML